MKDKLIDWDGRPARLEIAVDITEQELLSRDTARKLEKPSEHWWNASAA